MKKEELLKQLDSWRLECSTCAQHHNYDCNDGCTYQDECNEAYQQLVALIKKEVIGEKDTIKTILKDIEERKDFIHSLKRKNNRVA